MRISLLDTADTFKKSLETLRSPLQFSHSSLSREFDPANAVEVLCSPASRPIERPGQGAWQQESRGTSPPAGTELVASSSSSGVPPPSGKLLPLWSQLLLGGSPFDPPAPPQVLPG